jgi:hypothetical protein
MSINAQANKEATVQTFIPYSDFYESASVLDMKRLGKQRVETLQILNALAGLSKGWVNHPATKMWRGYETALVQYGIAICQEWQMRGYKDSCEGKIWNVSKNFRPNRGFFLLPSWWGDDRVHDSHKSKLLQKDNDWYSQFNWSVPSDLDYVWPIA